MLSWASNQIDKLSQTIAPPPTDGCTKFMYFIQKGDEAGAISCSRDFDPSNTVLNNSKGLYAIHMACQYAMMDLVRQLLTQGGVNLHTVDVLGNTPLHHASSSSSYGKAHLCCKMLVEEFHASVVSRNKLGQTPYDLAALDMVRQYLLPLQLQEETRQVINSGGPLPPGTDRGGYRTTAQQNIAPPPIVTSPPPMNSPSPAMRMSSSPYPMTSAPASMPIPEPPYSGNREYSRNGQSSAAIYKPTNTANFVRPDGFHSSSSDVNLQKKYGHQKVTIDPTIPAPPSSGNSNPYAATGANPYATGTNPYSRGATFQRYLAVDPMSGQQMAPRAAAPMARYQSAPSSLNNLHYPVNATNPALTMFIPGAQSNTATTIFNQQQSPASFGGTPSALNDGHAQVGDLPPSELFTTPSPKNMMPPLSGNTPNLAVSSPAAAAFSVPESSPFPSPPFSGGMREPLECSPAVDVFSAPANDSNTTAAPLSGNASPSAAGLFSEPSTTAAAPLSGNASSAAAGANWETYCTEDGTAYFYNTETKETSWTKPLSITTTIAESGEEEDIPAITQAPLLEPVNTTTTAPLSGNVSSSAEGLFSAPSNTTTAPLSGNVSSSAEGLFSAPSNATTAPVSENAVSSDEGLFSEPSNAATAPLSGNAASSAEGLFSAPSNATTSPLSGNAASSAEGLFSAPSNAATAPLSGNAAASAEGLFSAPSTATAAPLSGNAAASTEGLFSAPSTATTAPLSGNAASSAAVSNWETYYTEDGREYFYNMETKETSWTKPLSTTEEGEDIPATTQAPFSETADTATAPLNGNASSSAEGLFSAPLSGNVSSSAAGSNWETYYTEDGTEYFYNTETKETSWTKPLSTTSIDREEDIPATTTAPLSEPAITTTAPLSGNVSSTAAGLFSEPSNTNTAPLSGNVLSPAAGLFSAPSNITAAPLSGNAASSAAGLFSAPSNDATDTYNATATATSSESVTSTSSSSGVPTSSVSLPVADVFAAPSNNLAETSGSVLSPIEPDPVVTSDSSGGAASSAVELFGAASNTVDSASAPNQSTPIVTAPSNDPAANSAAELFSPPPNDATSTFQTQTVPVESSSTAMPLEASGVFSSPVIDPSSSGQLVTSSLSGAPSATDHFSAPSNDSLPSQNTSSDQNSECEMDEVSLDEVPLSPATGESQEEAPNEMSTQPPSAVPDSLFAAIGMPPPPFTLKK